MASFEGMSPVVGSQSEGSFPRLTPEMLLRASKYGSIRKYDVMTKLYKQGERGADLYVAIEGELQTFWCGALDDRELFITLRDGEFTGELNLLNQRETLVAARAMAGSQVLRIPRDRLRTFLISEPEIGELIVRTIVQRRHWLVQNGAGGLAVVGEGDTGDTARLERFLNANSYPYRPTDARSSADGARIAKDRGLTAQDLPAVISANWMLKRPNLQELATKLGIAEDVREGSTWDVLIAGAGPAGLATAVYSASEGLRTLVVDSYAPGGQAGTSSRIENYLGFSFGISGADLAKQAQVQAEKFGAVVAVSQSVAEIDCTEEPFCIQMEGGHRVNARAVVIATGAKYRRLSVPDFERFEGNGIHYAATAIDVQPCAGIPVVIVGGGNSAGQAAMFLSSHASHVHMLIRGPQLASSMSDYLVQRIHASKGISLHTCSEVVAVEGETELEFVTWKNSATHESTRFPTRHLFVMIGADPCTQWLRNCVELDDHGFVKTSSGTDDKGPFETSVRGIFAVGDVRSGSVKRVASAVGEGSVVVPAIHRYLGTLGA